MSEKTTLKINGQLKDFDSDNLPETLTQLLEHLDIDQATVVAEIEGEIIERKNFSTTKLKPNQSIELIRFVGGG